jgi:DNA-directed RNA polymerase subunit RPC12/RpoP
MKKCPRCHSSVLLDFADAIEAMQPVWKCLGCGREMLLDPEAQSQDELLLERIRVEESRLLARRQGRRV